MGPFLGAHLDTLNFAQLGQTVPANEQGEEGRNARDASKSPVRFLNKILEVHAIKAGEEGSHGKT